MRLMHALLLGTVAASPVLSQSDTATRRDTAFLAPTVVTVTRTPIAMARAPFAISVVTRDDIQRARPGLALDEALAGIPGVQVDNRYNYAVGERISIRGFGARAQFGVRGVRVLLDGVPMTLADGQTTLNNVDVGALGRVEVIRGPASALHGNASGGVIQLESDMAAGVWGGGPFGGELRSSTGAHGLMRTQASFSGRGRATGYSATLSRLAFGGFRQWSDARNDRGIFRFQRGDSARAFGFTANFVDYEGKNPGALSRALLAVNRDTAFIGNTRARTANRGSQAQGGLTWRQDVGIGQLDVAAHALTRNIDNPILGRIVVIGRGAGGLRASLSGSRRVTTGELRLSGGAEAQLQDDNRRNFVNDNGERGADTLNHRERVTNTAAFLQSFVDVAPGVLLAAGARYDRVRFRADDRLVGPRNPDDSGERAMSAFSPSVGVTVSVSPRLDLYTNYSTSFQTPTTSELANQESGAGGFNPTLEPQRARSVEAGANGRLSTRHVAGTYQVAAYRAAVRDALIPFEVPAVRGRQYFRNAGSTVHRGLETAATLALPASLSIRAAFAHTDARFDTYSVTTGRITTVFDGKRVPGIAANRADATLSLQPGRAFLDLDVRSSSSIPVDDANTERSEGYTLWGARAGLREIAIGRASLAPYLGVTNLFDRDYNTSVVVNALGGRYFEPGPGRSVYGGATLRF